jgi:predicted glycoside hydrolase/deacetylase ChbG (UPF0249 family)
MKYLIVNADDFGLSPCVNRGVARAHDEGIVTSASLMVRPAAAADAVALWRERPTLGLGLHLDFGEWAYRGGEWVELYRTAALDDPEAIESEIERQLEAFRHLTGAEPDHIDSHQHVHRDEPLRSAVLRLSEQLDVPVRHFCEATRYCGDFYGQARRGEPLPDAITPAALRRILEGLPAGVTEVACHPAEAQDFSSVYAAERMRELEALCHPEARAAIEDQKIELISFRDPPLRRSAP